MLANFGAGEASTKAIFDGLFKRVMLDKNFIQQRAENNLIRTIHARYRCPDLLQLRVADDCRY